MKKNHNNEKRRQALAREEAVNELVTAIDDLIDERIRDALGKNPYWGGSVYEAQKTLHIKLRKVLGLPDDPDEEED